MDISRRQMLGASAAALYLTRLAQDVHAADAAQSASGHALPGSRLTEEFKVAAVQAEAVYLDLKGGVDKTIRLIGEAASAGAKLVAFPELWLPGYPFGHESEQWKKAHLKQYVANSLQIGSEEWRLLLEAAAREKIFVSLGYSELEGDYLYMGQALIGADGSPVQIRRKLRPSGGERTVWSDGDASGLRVYETEIGRVGSLSCWEHMHPQMTYILQSQMEHIHIGAWPILPEANGFNWAGPAVNLAAARYYATITGAVTIVPCSIVGDEAYSRFQEIPASRWVPKGGGHARIYGGNGAEIGNLIPHEEEGLVMATVDPRAFSPKTEDSNGEFSYGVLQFILENYPGPRVPDKEHGSRNLVAIGSL
ncbi:nitrilase-related carbon-nitrogen hydrolase [Rhizobium rhizogenes]|uniref:Nitrilase n=1 Tax=Rhizobium rhizogenes (strain K84 / ATCC BAA-868) TaxID=311403 RepID=B9JQ32_RHIR8|nr:nitrilase-related carbon-nitrogen hydrolase [Rhizobium rhizogenes]ACM31251.1 nitrilase [Rhizobium rhizogenes K84]NTI46200.1 nitrilase [Rhizobium rhizogenes]OCJ19602.1 nitrilase [Agrobacterium sp. B131/95]